MSIYLLNESENLKHLLSNSTQKAYRLNIWGNGHSYKKYAHTVNCGNLYTYSWKVLSHILGRFYHIFLEGSNTYSWKVLTHILGRFYHIYFQIIATNSLFRSNLMFKTKGVTKTDINLRLNTNQSDFTLVQNQPMRAVGTYQVKESSR